MTGTRRPSLDRRVQKTEEVLAEALESLIQEKSYDSIAVREILDRANVGRSTFYTHYRGKDGLLVSRIRQIVGSAPPPLRADDAERLLSFSLPIFQHLGRHQGAGMTRLGRRGRTVLHQRLRGVLTDLLSEQLRPDASSVRRLPEKIPQDLLVQHVIVTFILVLSWWMESGSRLTAVQADEVFRAMVLPALTSTGGGVRP